MDSKKIFFGSKNGLIRLYDLKKKKKFFDFYLPEKNIDTFALKKTNKLYISAQSSISVWEKIKIDKWKKKTQVECNDKIQLLSFLKNSKIMVSATKNKKTLFLWNTSKKKLLFVGKSELSEKISSVKSSLQSNFFAIASKNQKISIFDNNGLQINSLSIKKNYEKSRHLSDTCLHWFDAKTIISGGQEKKIFIWDIRIKKKIICLPGHIDEIENIESHGRYFQSNLYHFISSGKKGTLKIWDIRKNKEILTKYKPKQKINSLDTYP
jgi:WD40 repeat protein